jgi:hypothetical protein
MYLGVNFDFELQSSSNVSEGPPDRHEVLKCKIGIWILRCVGMSFCLGSPSRSFEVIQPYFPCLKVKFSWRLSTESLLLKGKTFSVHIHIYQRKISFEYSLF